MNNNKGAEEDSYKQLLILEELSRDGEVTQRDISKRLSIALGLVNSYIKNLASKGYITVSTIPKKRYSYYLTPKGFVEKSRLAYQHLYNFTNLYNIARKDFRSLFQRLQGDGVERIAFCGVDEVAEIAYITLQEFGMELAGVVDGSKQGEDFFGSEVRPIADIELMDYDRLVITSFMKADALHLELLDAGVPADKIVVAGGR